MKNEGSPFKKNRQKHAKICQRKSVEMAFPHSDFVNRVFIQGRFRAELFEVAKGYENFSEMSRFSRWNRKRHFLIIHGIKQHGDCCWIELIECLDSFRIVSKQIKQMCFGSRCSDCFGVEI